MKPFVMVAIFAASLMVATGIASAQTVAVPLDTAKLSWTPGTGGTPAEQFIVKCGTAPGARTITKAVPATIAEVLVKDVVPNQGKYWCVVVAANAFGESAESNEVPFEVGDPPVAPTGLKIISQ